MNARLGAMGIATQLLLPAQLVARPLVAVPVSGADAGSERKAERTYAVELMVLHATNSKHGIDERIGHMPDLEKPPFSAYDSYKLLIKTALPLVKERPKPFRLPNGRMLETRLLEILPDDYVRISARVNQPRGKVFLPLLEVKARVGQLFIVAGQSFKKGILVLVFRPVRV
jgi:hypothetical protein